MHRLLGLILDSTQYRETLASLSHTSLLLASHPASHPPFLLRLYPLTLERSALLAQYAAEERRALDGVEIAWEEEREKVGDEFGRGRERVKERLLEGVEERRRRAREEKEGEGGVGG